MSKLDIGVGDDFPVGESGSRDELQGDNRRGRRHRHFHAHHHHMHRHHGHPHHRRHGSHGLGQLAGLLLLAGVAGLIVTHQFTATLGCGLVGAGAGLLVLGLLLRIVFHWRHHRRMQQAVS